MLRLTYLFVLLACVIGTLPLEFKFAARVYRRPAAAALSVLPVAAVFVIWDVRATAAGWWRFDPRYVLAPRIAGLPLEEVLFFLVVPVCALLTMEAVRHIRPDWAPDRWAARK